MSKYDGSYTWNTELNSERMKKYGQRQRKIFKEMWEYERESDGIDIQKSKELFKSMGISDSKKKNLFDKLKRYERKMMDELLEQVDILEKTKRNIKELKNSIHRIHNDILVKNLG